MVAIRQLNDGCKLEDKQQGITARLNGAGFWCSFRAGESFYRRCMDGSVVMGAKATPLSGEQAAGVHRQFHQWINSISLADGVVLKSQSLSIDDYAGQQALYQGAYPEEVCILPPDRYGDVVIQPAIGCPNRKCTFCAFYKEKPYQVLNQQDFISHLQAVRRLYGVKLATARGVFLGSANAMALSRRRLMFCLQQIQEHFGAFKREVATFADPDFSARRSPGDWEELRRSGLRHLVMGLESGWAELRSSLGKSGDFGKVSAMILSAKRVGMSIGLTVLTGVAPADQREKNMQQTLMTIKDFNLSAADTVYLSPFSDGGQINEQAVLEQQRFAHALRKDSGARVVPYQMQRFQYFA